MNNLAMVEVVEQTSATTGNQLKPVIAYRREEKSAEEKAKLVESIVDYLLANGSMPA